MPSDQPAPAGPAPAAPHSAAPTPVVAAPGGRASGKLLRPLALHATTQVGFATLLGITERIGIPSPFLLALLGGGFGSAAAAWAFRRTQGRAPVEREARWFAAWTTLALLPMIGVMFLAYLVASQGLDGLDAILDVRSMLGAIPAEFAVHPVVVPLLAVLVVGGTAGLNYWVFGRLAKNR